MSICICDCLFVVLTAIHYGVGQLCAETGDGRQIYVENINDERIFGLVNVLALSCFERGLVLA